MFIILQWHRDIEPKSRTKETKNQQLLSLSLESK